MAKRTVTRDFDFLGNPLIPAIGSNDGGLWNVAITGAAPPTCAVSAGLAALALTADSQAQIVSLYQGDKLGFDIDRLKWVEIFAKVNAAVQAGVSLAFGVCSARNDTIDSLAAHASFRTIGADSLLVETDDGTNDKDDIATGLSIGTTLKKYRIDFQTGIQSRVGLTALGGKAAVQFQAENSQKLLRRVAEGTLFDMSNYSAGLQFYAQIQKASGTDLNTLYIERFRACYEIED